MNIVSPWVSLLPLLFAYAFFVLVVSSLITLTDGVALLYSYAVFYPLLMLSGAWAVLGPGAYIVRTICSITAVLTVFVVGVLGCWGTTPSDQILHIAPQSPAETLFAIICFGIPLIYAAQFPYWLMRWIFGWQLIDGSKPSKQKKIGLKDMLTMMAALAVSAVAATQGTSMFNPTINDSVEIGDTKCEAITDPATGETTWDDIIVTEENIDQFRQELAAEAAELQNAGLMFVAGYVVFIVVSTLLNIPCFYSGMNNKNPIKAFYFAASYWLTLALILFFAILTIPDLGREIPLRLLHGIFLALLFAGAAATPMLVVRRNGGKLVSREFFRTLSKDSQSPAPKKVVDPFDD